MSRLDPKTVTRILRAASAGEPEAAAELLPCVYDELGGMARRLFASQSSGHTLQPTALIHEAWVKLAGHLDGLEDRTHFFAVASQAMRQVLADHARAAGRLKRGDGRQRVTLDESRDGQGASQYDLVDLDDSLTRLAGLNARHARIVELRVLGGLTVQEVADLLGVSDTTIDKDWFMAKAWLRSELAAAH